MAGARLAGAVIWGSPHRVLIGKSSLDRSLRTATLLQRYNSPAVIPSSSTVVPVLVGHGSSHCYFYTPQRLECPVCFATIPYHSNVLGLRLPSESFFVFLGFVLPANYQCVRSRNLPAQSLRHLVHILASCHHRFLV